MNNAAVKLGVETSLQDSDSNTTGYIPRIGIAGSYASAIFHFFRNFHTIFQYGYILHSHTQCKTTPVSPHHCQNLSLFFYDGHSSKCEVITHSGFDLHFPDYL